MNYELYAQVVLLKDVPEWNLRKGDVATIVDKHPGASGEVSGFSVEVFNVKGDTIAVFALAADEIEPLEENEVFQVRKLEPIPA